MYKFLTTPLDICCEFGSSDDVYARGKATSETADVNFLMQHLCHHCTNSSQITSDPTVWQYNILGSYLSSSHTRHKSNSMPQCTYEDSFDWCVVYPKIYQLSPSSSKEDP